MADTELFVLTVGTLLLTAFLIWRAPLITEEDMEWIKKDDPWFKDEE